MYEEANKRIRHRICNHGFRCASSSMVKPVTVTAGAVLVLQQHIQFQYIVHQLKKS